MANAQNVSQQKEALPSWVANGGGAIDREEDARPLAPSIRVHQALRAWIWRAKTVTLVMATKALSSSVFVMAYDARGR